MKRHPVTYDGQVEEQADIRGYGEPAITSYQARKYPAKDNDDGEPFFYNTNDIHIEEYERAVQDKKLRKCMLKERGIV